MAQFDSGKGEFPIHGNIKEVTEQIRAWTKWVFLSDSKMIVSYLLMWDTRNGDLKAQ